MGFLSFFRKKPTEDTSVHIQDTSTETEFAISDSIEDYTVVEDAKEIDVLPTTATEKVLTTSNDEEVESIFYDPTEALPEYQIPPLELLEDNEDDLIAHEEVEQTKATILSFLQNNKIEILSITADVGYVNTLYEIIPKAGTRISTIKRLNEDMAFALLAPKLSIEPIIERGTIGIIVPNKYFTVLPLSALLRSKAFNESGYELPIALGRTMKTEDFIIDLTEQPHILIAGATGQGKSVIMNDIIISLLYKKHPSEVKLILIDQKKIEFHLYSELEKHYLAKLPSSINPIINDPLCALETFVSLSDEMKERYNLLAQSDSKNITDYNTKFKARKLNPTKGHRFMPYLVVVIDEYHDLALITGDQIESQLSQITRNGHIVGIHVILATQRPTKDLITGDLKNSFPVRIAFRVAASMESRIILDENGAEELSGRGDCLYSDGIKTTRLQAPFVNTEEIERITCFILGQEGYNSAYTLPEFITPTNNCGINDDLSNIDSIFEEVARFVVCNQQGSTAAIQRRFSIGYNRAGRIMDQLEGVGIVGRAEGSKPREILILDISSLENILSSL